VASVAASAQLVPASPLQVEQVSPPQEEPVWLLQEEACAAPDAAQAWPQLLGAQVQDAQARYGYSAAPQVPDLLPAAWAALPADDSAEPGQAWLDAQSAQEHLLDDSVAA
jgi:hypothetical protein